MAIVQGTANSNLVPNNRQEALGNGGARGRGRGRGRAAAARQSPRQPHRGLAPARMAALTPREDFKVS